MSRIEGRMLMILLERNHVKEFENFINSINSHNMLKIDEIINSLESFKISLVLKLPEISNIYSQNFLSSIEHLEILEHENILFNYCVLWARDADHIFKDHIEIELKILINHQINAKLDYKEFSKRLGTAVNAKLIYEILDFEHFDLHWHENKEMNIRVSNIETLENEVELLEAINLMKTNIAAND